MQNDEQQIRQVVADWMAASKAGDTDRVLALMTDDAVFLLPGRAPMRKVEFESLSRQQASGKAALIDGHSEIQEIEVCGDRAFMWTHLTVRVTPPGGGAVMESAGHTLTVLKRINGRWLLARDANLLVPVGKG